MLKRIILDIVFFLGILFASWWVSVLLALVFLFYLNKFYEIIIAGIIIDAIYGNGQFYFTAGAIVVFLASYIFKNRVRYYK